MPQQQPAVSEDAKEAICPHVPEILTEPVRVPDECKNAAVGDDYQACLEAVFGPKDKPEEGIVGACNADKFDIRKCLTTGCPDQEKRK